MTRRECVAFARAQRRPQRQAHRAAVGRYTYAVLSPEQRAADVDLIVPPDLVRRLGHVFSEIHEILAAREAQA